MNLRIEQLKNQLKKLEDYINSKAVFQKQELLLWIATTIAFLSEVGINSEIVNGFMRTFEFKNLRCGLRGKPEIGPFVYDFDINDRESGYKLENNFFSFDTGKPSQDIYYVRVAFTAIRAKLNREQEEERLVPKFIIDCLSNNGKYGHIISSLELIEQSYSNKDTDGLVKNSITLLGSILDLDDQLKDKGSLSRKLSMLNNNKVICAKFGIEKEYIFALNNSRIVRNIKSAHKNLPLKYDMPFVITSGFAYLIVMFLEITIATGEILK